MNNIFISYQAKDTARSHLFFQALEVKGYNVWLYEKHCHGGKYHREQVLEEISKSAAFVFVMSDNSILSQEVTFELQMAKQENKPIFPIYFDRKWEDFLNIKTDWRSILKTRTGINAEHSFEKAIEYLIIGLEKENIYGKINITEERERIVPFAFSGSLDHFINRTKELESLKKCIEDNSKRLILLTGPGGYGKSALLEKLISEITDNYCLDKLIFDYNIDSIVWLDLRAEENRSVDALFNLLTKTFPKHKSSDFSSGWNNESNLSNKLEFLFGRLLSRDRRLIILDNFESVLDNTKIGGQYKDLEEFINAFLNIDHASIIIATSQKRLTLSPEIEGKYAQRKSEIIMDYGLPEDEAVNLLINLDTDGVCEVGNLNKDILKQVVQKLNCAPRTLETLIGILKNDDIGINEFYIEKEFEDLIANPSKELVNGLKKEQKQIIEVLSIFNRPVTREAIQSLLPGVDTKTQLISLKRCFAIKINENKQYYLHSIIQKVVYDQISEAGEKYSIELHKKAAGWYARHHLNQNDWTSYDNIQSFINEIQHLILASEFNKACGILNLIDREYLAVWNYHNLIIRLRYALLGKITDEKLIALNIGNLGCAHLGLNQTAEANMYFQSALDISRKINDVHGECRWLGNLALTVSTPQQAEQMMQEAYQLAVKINDYLHIGRWQGKLANMKRNSGKLSLEAAILELENALRTTRLDFVHDKRFASYWLYDLYLYNIELGNETIATGYLDEAIETTDSIGDYLTKANYLIKSYNAKIKSANPLDVVDSLENAFALKLKIGRQDEAYQLAEYLASFYLSHGIANKAFEKYCQILEFSREVGNHSKELHYLWQIGLSQYMRGDFTQSLSSFIELKKRATDLQLLKEEHSYDFNIGDSYLQLQDFDKALEYFKMSLGQSDYLDFVAHYVIALICLKNKKVDEADEHFSLCFKIYWKLSENNNVSHQIDFIYANILVMKNKPDEAEKKIRTTINDKNLTEYTLIMALHDIRLAKKILSEYSDFNKLEEILKNKVKILNEAIESPE